MIEDKLSYFSFLKKISFSELGLGFFIGFVIGFLIKKSLKFILFLVAVFIIFLFILGYKEFIDLNNAIITNQSDKIVMITKDLFHFLKNMINLFSIELSSSAIFGFFIGFKLG